MEVGRINILLQINFNLINYPFMEPKQKYPLNFSLYMYKFSLAFQKLGENGTLQFAPTSFVIAQCVVRDIFIPNL